MTRKLRTGLLCTVAGLVLMISGCALGRAALAGSTASADVAANLIRLHVVANSDSESDQELKRAVRDAILAEVTPLFVGLEDGNQAREAISAAIPRIEAVAAAVVTEWGQSYGVHAEVGRFRFPGKAYGRLFLPAGEYNALKVMIGEAAGANWWCILFPPLCFADWATGIVLEPTRESGGTETVARPRTEPVAVSRKTAVAMATTEQLEKAPVRARSAVADWVRRKVLQPLKAKHNPDAAMRQE